MGIVINRHTIVPFLFLVIAILVNAIFGLIVLTRTYRKAYGWFFAATVVSVALWAFGDMIMLLTKDPSVVHMGAELFYIGPMLIPLSIWFFALSFPEEHRVGTFKVVFSLSIFFIYALVFLFQFDFFIKDIVITPGVNISTPHSPGFILYAAFFSIFFILVYAAFFLKIRRLRGVIRIPIAYTFYGAFGASLPALIINLSLPLMGKRDIIWLGPFFTLLFAVSVTAAIVRHRLFDIRFYAVRATTYLFTVAVVGIVYVIPAVLLTAYLLNASLQASTLSVLAFITLIVASLFQPLSRLFRRWTNRLFYQDIYDPQSFIDQLNKVLVENVGLDRLLREASKVIGNNLKAEFCLFGIHETKLHKQRIVGTIEKHFSPHDILSVRHTTPHFPGIIIVSDNLPIEYSALKRTLTKNNVSILGRLVPETELNREGLGYLILGQKRSGNPYNGQDIKVISTIVKELLIAIQNALHYEEIENFNATLQEKIEQATRKLRQTNDKLRKMDETKDDFISMASHQLRTPLTSVKGYVSMVLDGDAGRLNGMQRRLLNQSFVSAQRMVYLISDLLNVSRLRTGKFVIEPIASNLAEVITDEIEQLVETAESRNLTLTYHKPEHFPMLMLDETKMRQVIMNFIDNAIYYTPSGRSIDVYLIEKPQSIEFTVVDNGIGVPRHEQHHLFTKFYRADNAKRARPDGTGLGLFMAKKVVIAQGGAIIFKSQEGVGSTFGFSFAKNKLLPSSQAGMPEAVHK